MLFSRTYTKKCSNLYLMPPSVVQIINQNARALTCSSRGKKCVAQSEQATSLWKEKKMNWFDSGEHIRKSVNSKSTKVQLYFSQAVTKLGSYRSACTRCFRWNFLVTGLSFFHSHYWFSCTNAYWPSLIIIFFGSAWEAEFHLIVPPGPGTGQSCLHF